MTIEGMVLIGHAVLQSMVSFRGDDDHVSKSEFTSLSHTHSDFFWGFSRYVVLTDYGLTYYLTLFSVTVLVLS